MAEVSFSPQAPVGYVADRAYQGFQQGESMMDRARKRQEQEELQQMRRQQFAQEQAMIPLQRKKIEADLAAGVIQYQSALNMQEAEKKMAPLVGTAEAEFNDLMMLADPEARANAALAFSGKYAQFKNTKRWGQQFAAYDAIAQDLYKEGTSIRELEARKQAALEEAQIRSASAMEIAKIRTNASQANQASRAAISANKPSASQKKFDEEIGTSAAKYFTSVQEKAAENQRALDTIQSSRDLLNRGAKQGTGIETMTALMDAANSVTRLAGVNDLFDTSQEQQLQRNYSDFALSAASRMKNQGQITESERRLLSNTVARFGNSPKAAQYIMDYMEAVATRELEKASYLNAIRQERGIVDPSAEGPFYQQNPLSYFMPIRESSQNSGVASQKPIQIKSIKLIQ